MVALVLQRHPFNCKAGSRVADREFNCKAAGWLSCCNESMLQHVLSCCNCKVAGFNCKAAGRLSCCNESWPP